jgi:CheY-like chemotaxis protein
MTRRQRQRSRVIEFDRVEPTLVTTHRFGFERDAKVARNSADVEESRRLWTVSTWPWPQLEASYPARIRTLTIGNAQPRSSSLILVEMPDEDDLCGIKLLVVDDQACVRDAYRALLANCGATVMTADSGNSGWRQFLDNRPDVVISDVQMPDGNGYELVRRIRALPAEEGGLTPAIAMSGDFGAEDSIAAGFHVHLVKPADTRELIHLLRSFVHEGRDSR